MKKLPLALTGLMAASLLTACGSSSSATNSGSSGSDSGKVKLEFFQNKPEARATFDKLLKQFMQENPNIVVTQSNPPDAETVLKTRVAKHDVPDVMGLGDNATFGELAKTGVFADFANDPNLQNVQPAYIDMLKAVSGLSTPDGIPYTANANGVLYNKTLFTQLGLTIPQTYDELIADAKKVQAAGKIPFYYTFKDSWTTLVPFNSLASSLEGDTFMKDRADGKTTFQDGYKEIAQKFADLMQYGHKDMFGKGYDDGNTAFANGQSVMYMQGVWAIPNIKKANPNIQLGSFPFPASNDPSKNKLVSGVDTLLTMSKTTKHQAEAQKLIDFLMKPEVAKQYITEQSTFSAVKGVTQDDPDVADLKSSFEQGKLVDFADHYFPSAMKLDTLAQTFAKKKDVNEFLKTLDTQWDKVQSHK